MSELISVFLILCVACLALYFLLKFQFERDKKFYALIDEMCLYFKNLNNKEN